MHDPFGVFEEEVRSHLIGLDRKLETLDRKLDLIALGVQNGFDGLGASFVKRAKHTAPQGVHPALLADAGNAAVGLREDAQRGPADKSSRMNSSTKDRPASPVTDATSDCIAVVGEKGGAVADPDGEDRRANPALDEGTEPQRKRRLSLASSMSSIGFNNWDMDFIRRSRPGKWRQCVWDIMEDPDSSLAARWFPRFFGFLIIVSSLLSLMDYVPDFPLRGTTVIAVELCFDVIFAVEVTLRFLVSRTARVFISNAHNIIDLVAALPLVLRIYLLIVDEEVDRIATTILVAAPLVRLLKVLRHVRHFYLFVRLLQETRSALGVLFCLLLTIVITFSTLVYLVEPRSNVQSLPGAMYLIIVTISTVGYGDVTPETTAGYMVISLMIPFSVLYMAMPIGIVGNAFTRIWTERDKILLTIKTQERLTEWGYTAADTKMLLRHFDANSNGELSLHEFRQMIAEMRLSINDDRVVELFDSFDKDGSGEIDPKEFTRMLFPSTFYELLDREDAERQARKQAREDAERQAKEMGTSPITPQPSVSRYDGGVFSRINSKASSRNGPKRPDTRPSPTSAGRSASGAATGPATSKFNGTSTEETSAAAQCVPAGFQSFSSGPQKPDAALAPMSGNSASAFGPALGGVEGFGTAAPRSAEGLARPWDALEGSIDDRGVTPSRWRMAAETGAT